MGKRMVFGTGEGDILIGVEISPKEEIYKALCRQYGASVEKMASDGIWIYREEAEKVTYLSNDNVRYKRPATILDKEVSRE